MNRRANRILKATGRKPDLLSVVGAMMVTARLVVASEAQAEAPIETPSFVTPGADLPSRYTDAYTHCPGFKTGLIAKILACVARERDLQDKRLDAALETTLRALPPSRKLSLKIAQDRWIAYRAAWCGITDDPSSGPEEKIASGECTLHETMRQTLNLEKLARDAPAM